MNPLDPVNGLAQDARQHLAGLIETNGETLRDAAVRMLEVIEADGLIFTAGTGHSLALVLETFYRAGGLACVYPLYHPGLLPLAGGQSSTLLERTPGLAQLLLASAQPTEADMAFVFSNSGINPVPVELAQGLQDHGTTVVAVVSLPHLRRAPQRAGAKLDQRADMVLDTRVPYGDAAYPAGQGKTAPLSSLSGIYLWNVLLALLADLATERGVELPLWASANVEGGTARNQELLERYRDRIPFL